jgi:hypothetical protein
MTTHSQLSNRAYSMYFISGGRLLNPQIYNVPCLGGRVPFVVVTQKNLLKRSMFHIITTKDQALNFWETLDAVGLPENWRNFMYIMTC